MSGMAPARRRGEPSLATRAFYGVGSVAFGLKDTGFSYLLLIFYNQVMGLPSATVGLAVMIALVVDAMLDPLIGHLTDNWRSRWGRRHPFMYFAAIPAAVSYLLIWRPPAGLSHEALFFYIIVTAILTRTSLALFEIPSTALSAELTSDYDARTRLISLRASFQWYGSLLMTLATFQVFLKADAQHPSAQLNPAGYSTYGLTASAIIFAVIMISALGTHRQIPFLREPPPRKSLKSFLSDMVETLANKPLRAILLSGVFDSMGYGLGVSLSLYFNTYFWGLTAPQISLFVVSQLFSSAFAVALATPLSVRLGKKRGAIVCKVLALAVGSTPLLLRLCGVFFENGDRLLLPVLFMNNMVSVTFASIAAILGSSMLSDIVENSELETGRRSEGLFFAAMIFIGKAVSGIGIFASSMLLLAVGFPDTAHHATVAPAVIRRLALVYVPTHAVITLLYIALISRYGITRQSHSDTLAQLEIARLARQGPP